MLKRGIKYFILSTLFFSCSQKQKNANLFYDISRKQIGDDNYRIVLSKLKDSIEHWKLNEISLFYIDTSLGYSNLDTLLCFNNTADRFITCIHTVSKNRSNPTGSLSYFFGEKQEGFWYFFSANTSVFIPNSMKRNKKSLFFEYDELHAAAMPNIYEGYLLPEGRINEAWFDSHFENIGWGNFNDQKLNLERMGLTKKFTDRRKFFEAIHLQKVKYNWAYRDTTKPIVPFPINSLQ